MDNVDIVPKSLEFPKNLCTEISTEYQPSSRLFSVDIVNNYCCKRFSPIFTTSPAPIVINKSFFVQFVRMKFSISSKDEK